MDACLFERCIIMIDAEAYDLWFYGYLQFWEAFALSRTILEVYVSKLWMLAHDFNVTVNGRWFAGECPIDTFMGDKDATSKLQFLANLLLPFENPLWIGDVGIFIKENNCLHSNDSGKG